MTECGEVHADLMSAPGEWPAGAEDHLAETLERSKVGARAPRPRVAGVSHTHRAAASLDERQVASDRRRQIAARQRQICLLRASRFEGLVERTVRGGG